MAYELRPCDLTLNHKNFNNIFNTQLVLYYSIEDMFVKSYLELIIYNL